MLGEGFLQPKSFRWSVATAIFGGVCNLLSWILMNYWSFYLMQEQFILSNSLLFVECIVLAPLLVLFNLRHVALVVFLYALALSSILIGYIQRLVQYHNFGAVALPHKIDSLGFISFVVGFSAIPVLLIGLLVMAYRKEQA